MKKISWLFTLLLLVALVGCSSDSKNTSSKDKGKASAVQELTYGTITDVAGLSPLKTNDTASSNLITQIYETLFYRNYETGEIEPLLAESYENPDDTTWVIKLHEGIKFHDGTPFNAEAVKYTIDKFKDPATAAPRASLLEPISEVIVQDEYTVVIKTKYPYGPLLAALAHSASSIVSPTADQAQDLNANPVGTGSFKFVEWVPGDHITLEKNKDYWREPAKLDKVTVKVVPETSTAISMLQTGEVQFIDNIPSDLFSRVESVKSADIIKNDGSPVYYLGFNYEREPMNNLSFRQAVASSIDTKSFVAQLKGLGTEGKSILGSKVFGYEDSAEDVGYDYDPERAKQLLKDNGFAGQEVKILVPNRDQYVQMAEIVQAQLLEVGLKVKIETMEWATFLDVAKQGDFDITFLGWTNSTTDGSELFFPNFHSTNIGTSNRIRYNNPAFDKVVEESRSTLDLAERTKKLLEANKILVDDAAVVVMNHGVVTAAVDKSVKGIEIDSTSQWYLYHAYRE